MGKINVLDCTLRDGGYCNQWKFGYNNIKKIIDGLDRYPEPCELLSAYSMQLR